MATTTPTNDQITARPDWPAGNPLDAGIANDLADTYLEVGRVDEAIDMAQNAIALDPVLAVGYETLAQALERAGRHEEAQTALERANEIRLAEGEQDGDQAGSSDN